jgi:hypothetical protein
MPRGQLRARSCCHDQAAGRHRQNGGNASSSGITPSTSMSPARISPRPRTEIRVSARACSDRPIHHAHSPPTRPEVLTRQPRPALLEMRDPAETKSSWCDRSLPRHRHGVAQGPLGAGPAMPRRVMPQAAVAFSAIGSTVDGIPRDRDHGEAVSSQLVSEPTCVRSLHSQLAARTERRVSFQTLVDSARSNAAASASVSQTHGGMLDLLGGLVATASCLT